MNASLIPGIGSDVQLPPASVVVYMAGPVRVSGISPATMQVLGVGQVVPKKYVPFRDERDCRQVAPPS